MVTPQVTLNWPAVTSAAATVARWMAVPPIVDGSRTSLSFSNAARTTYVPSGTPLIVQVPPPWMFGGCGGGGARTPGGVSPLASVLLNVEATARMTSVAGPVTQNEATMSTLPLTTWVGLLLRCRSTPVLFSPCASATATGL